MTYGEPGSLPDRLSRHVDAHSRFAGTSALIRWKCRCGRRWYKFHRSLWDAEGVATDRCPGCDADLAEAFTGSGWREL